MRDIKEDILADAIEQYIKAERRIIKLQKENLTLYIIIAFALTYIFCSLAGG